MSLSGLQINEGEGAQAGTGDLKVSHWEACAQQG